MTIPVLASALFRPAGSRALGVIINEHTITAEAAKRHIDALGRTFEFIHHDDLLDRIARPHRRPFCLLTFDDGKRSGYSDTAPALERLGVPAVFYVTTGFVGGDLPLWFDKHEALLAIVGRPPAGLELETLTELPIELLHERLDRACARYGVAPDMSDDRIRPMQWDEVRDLARRGFTIGAHGVRHTVLTREREADALAEIEQSIADVSRETGSPCRTFAFPNGNYTARLARHATACGAQTVVTTEPTWVDAHASPWHLPRIQLFGHQGRFTIELKLEAAASGFLLANPDGTGRLYRRIARMRAAAALRPVRV